jgi:hypothetical protein
MEWLAEKTDATFLRLQNAQNVFDKGAFTGTVWSYDSQVIAFIYGKRNITEDFQAVVAEGQVINAN